MAIYKWAMRETYKVDLCLAAPGDVQAIDGPLFTGNSVKIFPLAYCLLEKIDRLKVLL